MITLYITSRSVWGVLVDAETPGVKSPFVALSIEGVGAIDLHRLHDRHAVFKGFVDDVAKALRVGDTERADGLAAALSQWLRASCGKTWQVTTDGADTGTDGSDAGTDSGTDAGDGADGASGDSE